MTYFEIIKEIEQVKATLSSIKHVQIEGRLQWTGLIGVAQDMWKDRKFKKICQTQIVGNIDYLNLPFYLVNKAKELQQYLSATDNEMESTIAVALIMDCLGAWTNICPEVGYSTINDDIGKGHALPMILVVKHYLYSTFNEYNLDVKLKKDTESNIRYIDGQIKRYINPPEKNSGCFSILLLIAIPLSALYLIF